jgi:LysM repeat protein
VTPTSTPTCNSEPSAGPLTCGGQAVPTATATPYATPIAVATAPGRQSSSACGSLYVVQAGDTLSAIALHCQVPLAALQAANPNSDPLAIGRILAVPAAPAAPAGSATLYVIRAGDTLSALARRFGTTVAVLARYNGLTDPNRLRVGQMLHIPAA